MKGRRKTPLFLGPGKRYGSSDKMLEKGEIVYFEGLSLNQEWAKVILATGVELWTPYFNLEEHTGVVENEEQFLYNVKARHALTSGLSLQGGFGYGGRPMLGRAVGALLWNWFPDGLVDFRYDQTELGISGSYLVLGDEEAFFHGSVFMQWLYRMGEFRDFMIGPRIGWAVMNDPTSKFSYSNSLVLGLAARAYPTDHFGVFIEGETFIRTTVYVLGSAGISIRF